MMYGLTQDEWAQLQLSIGTHKGTRYKSPYEVGQLILKALNTTDIKTLANAIHLSGTDMLRKFIAITRLDEDLQALIDWGATRGAVSFSGAVEIVKLLDLDNGDNLVRELFDNASKHNLKSKEILQIVQIFRRSEMPLADCVKSVLKNRPIVVITELILGMIMDKTLINTLSGVPHDERNKLLKKCLSEKFHDVKFISTRLNVKHFSILLTQDNSKKLKGALAQESLEQIITHKLMNHFGLVNN